MKQLRVPSANHASDVLDFFLATRRAIHLLVWLLRRKSFRDPKLQEFRLIVFACAGQPPRLARSGNCDCKTRRTRKSIVLTYPFADSFSEMAYANVPYQTRLHKRHEYLAVLGGTKMIRKVTKGANGKEVVELIPETEEDLEELQRLYEQGKLDARDTLADEEPETGNFIQDSANSS